jgi:hypothetical protein
MFDQRFMARLESFVGIIAMVAGVGCVMEGDHGQGVVHVVAGLIAIWHGRSVLRATDPQRQAARRPSSADPIFRIGPE